MFLLAEFIVYMQLSMYLACALYMLPIQRRFGKDYPEAAIYALYLPVKPTYTTAARLKQRQNRVLHREICVPSNSV